MKTITMFLLLTVCGSAYAQEVDFKYSQVPTAMNKTDYLYRASIKFGVPFGIKSLIVKPYGSWETWAAWGTGKQGTPFRDTYGFGVDLEWKGVYIDLNHYCSHQVMSDKGYENKYQTPPVWDQKLTTISIGYRARFNIVQLWK